MPAFSVARRDEGRGTFMTCGVTAIYGIYEILTLATNQNININIMIPKVCIITVNQSVNIGQRLI